MKDLRDQTIRGIGWSSTARIVQQGSSFVVSVLLARMLLPADFGLIAIVLVFTGFATLFAELGLGAALVQREDLREEHTSSVFWCTLLLGLAIFAVFFLGAPYLADAYDLPALEPLAKVLAATFILGSIEVVPRSVLRRDLAFDRLAVVEITGSLVSGSAALVLAFLGAGVWALVARALIARAVNGAVVLYVCNWRPHRILSTEALREVFGFSVHYLGFNVINYWARNADNLLIGKLIGPAGLGIYTKAYSLMLLPLTQLVSVVGGVMFPALAKIQSDRARVKRVYLKANALIALVTFPVMAGLFVVAEPFILTLLGPVWAGSVPILQILALVGMIQALTSPTGWIYTSQGRTDWMFRWGVGGAGAIIVAIGIGASFGTVTAVAWSYLIVNVLLLLPSLYFPGKLIDMTLGDVAAAVFGALICSGAMAAAVWAVGLLLPGSLAVFLRLLTQIAVGAGVYSGLLFLLRPAGLSDLKSLASGSRAKMRQEALI